jgi:hypothetical protein
MAPNRDSPTLALPRISAIKFRQLLVSKNSPAVPESSAVYASLVNNGVDVSFALAQFRVESQYGTAGFAKSTGSWGNMLWDANLCKHAKPIGTATVPYVTKTTSSGATYTYATYTSYVDAVEDYSNYLHWYISQYGLTTIYGATARWIGKVPGSEFNLTYVDTVINDMTKYEYDPGDFYEVGDKMIYAGPSFDRLTGKLVQKYPVVEGSTVLYKGTDGTVLKTYQGTSGNAWFLGPVQGSWTWGAIIIGTSWADADATIVYIKNPDKNKVINI